MSETMIIREDLSKRKNELPEWMKKCLHCKHSYEKQNDCGTIYCRLRTGKCKYEEYKPMKAYEEVMKDDE